MKKDMHSQMALFQMEELTAEELELFPAVWGAAEELISPQSKKRSEALEHIIALNAHRLSPLVAYVLSTRIRDEDLDVRYQVVEALGQALHPEQEEQATPDKVRLTILGYLSRMRKRQIYALLQVADHYLSAEDHVAQLLNACSYGGTALNEIYNDRKAPASIRQQAIQFAGRVGFLDCIPGLERLVTRLEERSEKQEKMAFASKDPLAGEEALLIPARAALVKLKMRAERI
jgi:hypothetical protein